jgi:integrase/recombinase XerD
MTEYRIYTPPTYLEPNEIRAIINAVPSVSKHSERDMLVLETMWQTGGRVTEVLELTPKQVGVDSLVIRNLKQKPTSPPYKEVYITKNLVSSLKEYINEQHIGEDDFVFLANRTKGKHLSRWYVWWIITRSAKESNVKRVNARRGNFTYAWPHLFRHSCAMYILDHTGSTELAQRQLGHARITTTQGYAVLKLEKSRKGLADLQWL